MLSRSFEIGDVLGDIVREVVRNCIGKTAVIYLKIRHDVTLRNIGITDAWETGDQEQQDIQIHILYQALRTKNLSIKKMFQGPQQPVNPIPSMNVRSNV